MPLPDAATVHICSVLSSGAFGVMFLLLWIGRDRGLFHLLCAAGALTYSATLIGLAMPGRGILASSLLCVGLGMYNSYALAAVRGFEGRRMIDRWTVAPPLLCGLSYLGFALIGGAQAGRIVNSTVLGVATAIVGLMLLRTRGSHAPRARRMLGFVQLAYVPSYVASVLLEASGLPHADWLALVPMLSDQLLLGMFNIALLAMPGERAEAALREAALRDPLTGAWNRAGLAAVERGLGAAATVILLDIDHFKQVNDRHGHAAGDAVLVALAREATMRLPPDGHLVRLGGDEFAVVMTGAGDPDAARNVAERLRAIRLPHGCCTISLGIASAAPDEPGLAAAFSRADARLYRAKAAGRDRLVA